MDPAIHCLVDVENKTGTCGYFIYHGKPCKHYFACIACDRGIKDARLLARDVVSTPIPGDVRRLSSAQNDSFAQTGSDPLAFLPAAKQDNSSFPHLRQFEVDGGASIAKVVPGPAATRQPHKAGKRRKAGAQKKVKLCVLPCSICVIVLSLLFSGVVGC
jgi:hypothetical protein